MSNRFEYMDMAFCVQELQHALAEGALQEFEGGGGELAKASAAARQAAYRLAAALGRCRMFGVEVPPDLDGQLWPAVAMAAAERAAELVEQWTDETRMLGQRWDEALPEEGEDLVASTLEARMEAAFVMEAISECYQRLLEQGAGSTEQGAGSGEQGAESWERAVSQFEAALDALVDALEEFDGVLQAPDNLALLSTAVGLPLLENWRRCLAGPYKDVPPWWLNGTLEKVDRQVEQVVLATLPGPEAWRRLREGQIAGPRVRRWEELLRSLPAPISMAAKGAVAVPNVAVAHWRSPDGRYLADLPCPAQPLADQMLYLKVLRAEDETEAVELAGQGVVLGGVQARLDDRGRAAFRLDELLDSLRKGQAQVSLAVGPEGTLWEELPLEDFHTAGGEGAQDA